MKRLFCTVMGLCMLSPAMAYNENGTKIDKANKSKINSYMLDKSCVDVGKTLTKNGWMPYRDPNNLPGELIEPNHNQKLFKKYKELEFCRGTGLGECYGRFTKGNFNLSVEYYAEGGSALFEDKSCRASTYKIQTGSFD